jgi:hypothetical protein
MKPDTSRELCAFVIEIRAMARLVQANKGGSNALRVKMWPSPTSTSMGAGRGPAGRGGRVYVYDQFAGAVKSWAADDVLRADDIT